MKLFTPFVLLVFATQIFAADSIVRRSDGVTLRGEITKSTREAVTIRRTNGKEDTVSVSDIQTITFNKEPTQLGQARSNERSGALDAALEKLTPLLKSGSVNSRSARSEIEFLIARIKTKQAVINPALVDDALTAMTKFRNGHKTNFRYYEAALLQASLHAAKKQNTEGRILLEEVAACNVKGYQLQAGVDLGKLLLTTGDTTAAKASFDGVVESAGNDSATMAVRFDGMLGAAACSQTDGDTSAAIKTLDQIIADAPVSETRLLAESWNRKGDCLRQQDETKAALLAYLHVDLLYPAESAQHAEALYWLSKLWDLVGHKDRALVAASTLNSQYPNSSWAQKP